MKKILYSILIFLQSANCISQNLITNPSFEDTISCPNNWNQVERANGWYSVNLSPDYFNSCSSVFNVDVPTNYLGYANPAERNAYMGLATFLSVTPNYREILGSELNQILIPGTKYYITACIIRADTIVADCAAPKFGFKFSKTYWPNSNVIDNYSHFHSDSIYLDKTNWTTISGSFVADSAYQFIYIGNFYTDSIINPIQCSITGSYHFGYNLIDMICVSTDSLTCNFDCNSNVGFEETLIPEEISIYPNPFDEKIYINVLNNSRMEFSLFDLSNRVILQHEIINSKSIEAKNLPNGMYIYRILSKNGIVKMGKILKH